MQFNVCATQELSLCPQPETRAATGVAQTSRCRYATEGVCESEQRAFRAFIFLQHPQTLLPIYERQSKLRGPDGLGPRLFIQNRAFKGDEGDRHQRSPESFPD